MKVYIAGPYTAGDVVINVRNAIEAAERVAMAGHDPFIPHLTHFWHLVFPHPYEYWLRLDLAWLKACDALIRLPGESSGADREVVWCETHAYPVYYSVDEFLAANL